jgi:flavin-dependent dehydrogenase
MKKSEILEDNGTVQDTDVLIIGAGPAGLSLAVELGSQGQRCIVVERHEHVGYAPRAKTSNVRCFTAGALLIDWQPNHRLVWTTRPTWCLPRA